MAICLSKLEMDNPAHLTVCSVFRHPQSNQSRIHLTGYPGLWLSATVVHWQAQKRESTEFSRRRVKEPCNTLLKGSSFTSCSTPLSCSCVCFQLMSLTAGWQSCYIACVLNSRYSLVWNTDLPHPRTYRQKITLMRLLLTALSRTHTLALCAAVGFSGWPVAVAEMISGSAVNVRVHTHRRSRRPVGPGQGSEWLHTPSNSWERKKAFSQNISARIMPKEEFGLGFKFSCKDRLE